MSTDENKALVRRWVEILNSENWAEQWRAENPVPKEERFIQEHGVFRAAFADYHFTLDGVSRLRQLGALPASG
jgi:hypothetical protein